MLDNAFVQIADYAVANQLANEFDVEILHQRLDEFAQAILSDHHRPEPHYHWSIMQAEYATDLVFKNRDTLQAFYPHLLETLTHAVKPADIATFLGRKLNGNYQGEMGNRFNKRWLGTRIKHQMGPVSIKMYDKFRFILRIERGCTILCVNEGRTFVEREWSKHNVGREAQAPEYPGSDAECGGSATGIRQSQIDG